MKVLASFLAGLAYLAWELVDDLKLVWRYYRKPRYVLADVWLQIRYFFTPVAQLCRWALRGYPDHQVQRIYGETSLTQFAKLAKTLQLSNDDCCYELGCGRGRLAFWLALHTQCKRVVGVDLNPVFIRNAQQISQTLRIHHLDFQHANLMQVDLAEASVIYLYGSAFSDEAIANIQRHLLTCRAGTRIISVSFELTGLEFELLSSQSMRFVWGEADVFIQKRLG